MAPIFETIKEKDKKIEKYRKPTHIGINRFGKIRLWLGYRDKMENA